VETDWEIAERYCLASAAVFPGSQWWPLPGLGQEAFGKVDPFLELGELSRLVCQAVLDVLERDGLLLHSLPEMGRVGSAGSASGYRPGDRPHDENQGAADDCQGQ